MKRLLAVLLVAGSLSAQAPKYIPIAAARAQASGNVSVMGLVTVPSGDFRSSSEDNGFAVQDQTGGIWVSVKKNPDLKLGQRVLITGLLGISAGKLQIVPADPNGIQSLPDKNLRVATGQVGKYTLGFIVTIEGTITDQGVVADPPYGWKLWLDDGSGAAQVYLNASTNIDPNAPYFKAGRALRVTGFGNQYDTAYEVDPRSKSDVVPLPAK